MVVDGSRRVTTRNRRHLKKIIPYTASLNINPENKNVTSTAHQESPVIGDRPATPAPSPDKSGDTPQEAVTEQPQDGQESPAQPSEGAIQQPDSGASSPDATGPEPIDTALAPLRTSTRIRTRPKRLIEEIA